jgi:alanine dehydrogenase
MLREGQMLFTYLHLAPDPEQTKDLLASGCTASPMRPSPTARRLPLLAPMSEVAGRMAIAGRRALRCRRPGRRGVLLGGVPGVAPAKVVVIGGGVVGTNAAQMAVGMGADVTVLDRSLPRCASSTMRFGTRSRPSTPRRTPSRLLCAGRPGDRRGADPRRGGAQAGHEARMLKTMKPGAVLVDVAIDQGGCFETSHATTHADPTYVVDGVVHYCVANMPGAVARTSTFALNNATLPFVLALADKGWHDHLEAQPQALPRSAADRSDRHGRPGDQPSRRCLILGSRR